MSTSRFSESSNSFLQRSTSLGDLLAARPSGLVESETWAILCQSVQALQDLFLSDGLSGKQCIPLVTPSTLMLSSKGRVKLYQSLSFFGSGPPAHLAGYLAPEYKMNRNYSDTEIEKMWIFALGETLKRATLTSHAATIRLSKELCQVLADMTRGHSSTRASLMLLLDVMSQYCKRRQQNRPFSHIVMDLHQEALASIEASMDTPWGPPAMPEIIPRTRNRSESSTDAFSTVPRRWHLPKPYEVNLPKLTKEAATSMENLSILRFSNKPGNVARPKSMCVPDRRYFSHEDNNLFYNKEPDFNKYDIFSDQNYETLDEANRFEDGYEKNMNYQSKYASRQLRVKRNPVQRAASRLYRAGIDLPTDKTGISNHCIGPEFVVRASLPTKKFLMPNCKGSKKVVTIVMLDGQKLDVTCNPSNTTAGQLFEFIIQKEHIEENFMLGLSALIAGDFVFIPSDTKISKAIQPGNDLGINLMLFLRIRFFLPSLRGIKGSQARHLLYLQLRRSILEHQLPCSFSQIIELNGLALQAEFGNYNESEHGSRDYFLLEHYVPETMTCVIDDQKRLREELIKAHISKKGLECEKAEQDFIIFTQNLPHYGGHFYTATWMLKDSNNKDIWLYISAQGINLYERGKSTSSFGPQLYETFEWKSIQTLCYSKYYLCIFPHRSVRHRSKLKKYKLKMDHKKSYFAFRLASLHHQFFLRLRTEYTTLQSLSQQFGIPLKDAKNEANSLCKLEAISQPIYSEVDSDEYGTVNAETEFKVDFRSSLISNQKPEGKQIKRSQSVQGLNKTPDQTINEDYQNKENENPRQKYDQTGLVLDSSYFAGLGAGCTEKRKGVKMGTRVFSNNGRRFSRSMEAVNSAVHDYLEQMSLQSVSLDCSSTSVSKSSIDGLQSGDGDAYVLDSTIKSVSQQNFLPNFQESINDTLLEKVNNMSFVEERILSTVTVERDVKGSLGLQITEGSDGNVYVQSVILGGSAHLSQGIISGDQVVAVNGHSLLGRNYNDSLEILKNTGQRVEFILSRVVASVISPNKTITKRNLSDINEDDLEKTKCNVTQLGLITPDSSSSTPDYTKSKLLQRPFYTSADSPVEKHVIENCQDISNSAKYGNLFPRENSFWKNTHQLNSDTENNLMFPGKCWQVNTDTFNKNISKSLSKLPNDRDRAVIVEMIPKKDVDWSQFPFDNKSLESRRTLPLEKDRKIILENDTYSTNKEQRYIKNDSPTAVALPRSMGLSRKWKGPVRYPVTPVKKTKDEEMASTSDEEQVFI